MHRFLARTLLMPVLLLVVMASRSTVHAERTVPPAETPVALTFGVYQTDKATAMYRQFTPIVEAIQAPMEASLGRPVDIELRIFKTYDEANDAIVNGTVDFVRFGPASYAIAVERNPDIALLAMELNKGEKRFNGVIVTRTDAPYESLSDLRGARFAFGNASSTIGRYLAQAELIAAGIHAGDLESFEYLGRHDKVFSAVALGDFDAGSLKMSTFRKMNGKGELRILHTFENVTKPWLARAELEAEVRTALSDALIGFSDPAALKSLKASGFARATDEDYEFVRRGMRAAASFTEPEHVAGATTDQ